MTMDSEQRAAAQQRLSTLMDGELDATAVGHACADWRSEANCRADWHAYHLIGDVLRSDDLAGPAAHDADFLTALRARLAAEPIVLAPRPLEHAHAAPAAVRAVGGVRSPRRSWMTASAVAAGFVAVAGVVSLTRAPSVAPERLAELSAPQVERVSMEPSAGLGGTEPQSIAASGQMIRDARLDRYLDAHQQFAGSSALGVPSGFLRSATALNATER